MSKIYTKTGDKGQTSLFNGIRVPKNNIRVETYGTIDELNSTLGVVLAELAESRVKNKELREELEEIQKDLFEIGSMLANSDVSYGLQNTNYFSGRIESFEKLIDSMTEELPPLANFILPGGGKAGSFLHVARAVSRRAERRIVELSQVEGIDDFIIRYINRLSDLLFTMSRYINFKENQTEIVWNKRS